MVSGVYLTCRIASVLCSVCKPQTEVGISPLLFVPDKPDPSEINQPGLHNNEHHWYTVLQDDSATSHFTLLKVAELHKNQDKKRKREGDLRVEVWQSSSRYKSSSFQSHSVEKIVLPVIVFLWRAIGSSLWRLWPWNGAEPTGSVFLSLRLCCISKCSHCTAAWYHSSCGQVTANNVKKTLHSNCHAASKVHLRHHRRPGRVSYSYSA